jgi:hypothetical protein
MLPVTASFFMGIKTGKALAIYSLVTQISDMIVLPITGKR